MANIRITIKGELGYISVSRFLTVLDHSLHILKDLDRHFSASRIGSLHWVISGIGEGSDAFLELESRVFRGKEDFGIRVRDAFTDAIETIEYRGATPKHFNTAMLEKLHDMTREFGKDGIQGVCYSVAEKEPIGLDIQAEKTLIELIGTKYKAIGSIEGRIELISIHKQARRFDIYQSRTEKAVRCNFPVEIEQDVFKAAEERRRVVISGVISYNARNEPVSILVKPPIRFLKTEEELPTIEDMRGLDRNITDNLSSEEYIRSIRE